VSYQVHSQSVGWQDQKSDGEIAGTTGRGLRMEGLKINVSNSSIKGGIEYSSHVRLVGWQGFVSNNALSGTTGQGLQIEAVRIRLTGDLSRFYDVYYRVHAAHFGWMGWAKNGADAGSSGFAYRMEAIQIQLVAKTENGPAISTAFFKNDNSNLPTVNYQAHSQSVGWQNEQKDGETAGTTGRGLRLEGLRANVTNTSMPGGIEYSSHVRLVGWQGFVSNNALSGTTGQGLQIEAVRIRLTGELSRFYDVYYRVHSAYFGWLGWAKNGADAGSSGFAYRMESIQIRLVVKGQGNFATETSFYDKSKLSLPNVNYQAHSRQVGWQNQQSNGATAGTTGRGLRMEALRANISDTPLPGTIEYSSHVRLVGWQGYVNNNLLSGTTGQGLQMEAIRIRLTGQLNQLYDVYYRVHSARFGWLGWARNDQRAGTSGLNLPMEAIQIVLVQKGAAAPGSTDTPYRTSIDHLFVMGHGVADPGASYNGVNERDFTRNELLPYLRKWAGRLSQNRITFYDTNADMFQDSRRMQGAYTISSTFASVSEFHLDAGAIESSTGGHVIVHRDSNFRTAQNFAIANTIRDHVGWWGSVAQTNGLSARADLLNMNVLHSRNIPYRLAELGFITNSRDVANIRRNIDQISKRIVEGVTGESL
jgi:uncharacterized protein YjdB